MDNKQLYDIKIFEKALKIILSKSEKPKEEFFSSNMIRYNEATARLIKLGDKTCVNCLI